MIQDETSLASRRLGGRPNQITLAMILEAALSIGLDDVTMTSVAERLGVSIGSLYRYVRNRDELVRLVANRQVKANIFPEDVGQHWADLVRGQAEVMFNSFAGRPGLISEYARGGFPLSSEVDGFDIFLQAMYARDFKATDAFSLMCDVRALVLGTAIVATAIGAANPDADTVDTVFATRGQDELVLLRSVGEEYRRYVAAPDWRAPVEQLLQAAALRRGETLPDKSNP